MTEKLAYIWNQSSSKMCNHVGVFAIRYPNMQNGVSRRR